MNSLKFFCFTLCAAYFSVAYADITAKDQTSIEAICKNIKPLLSVVLQSHDLKKEPFKHTPNKIASTSKEVVEKVKKNVDAMNKILGSVTQHPFEELVKRIDVNKNKATPEEFLSASKALRHIDPKNDPKKIISRWIPEVIC